MSEFQFPSFKLLQPLEHEATFLTPPKKSSLLPTQPPQSMVPWTQAFTTEQLFSFVGDGYTDMGKLYRPTGFFGFNDVHGLVLMAHGQLPAKFSEAYKYAMDHIGRLLAHRGYVCISVAPVPPKGEPNNFSKGTTATLIRHLVHVNGIFGNQFFIKGKPLALIGHSQGGGRAVEAAIMITKSKIAGYTKVDAIIGLAPTYVSIGSERPTDAYLCMAGTCDGDTPVSTFPGVALETYGNLSQIKERYFLMMDRCNHRQFTQRSPSEKDYSLPDNLKKGPIIGSDAQNVAVAQYSTMFLLWKLQGLGEYRAVFIGEKRLNLVSNNTEIQTDFNSLRVLPRFDRSRNVVLASLPEAFSATNILAYKNPPQNSYKPLQEFDISCNTEKTRALVRVWNASIKSKISFICDQSRLSVQIAAVEFHAIVLAQLDVSASDVKAANVEVYFMYGKDGALKSAPVQVNIEHSWSFFPQFSVLSTIRIPMALFGFKSLSEQASAVKLVIDFTNCNRKTGAIAFTNCRLAFS